MNSQIKQTFWQGTILHSVKFQDFYFLLNTISAAEAFTYDNIHGAGSFLTYYRPRTSKQIPCLNGAHGFINVFTKCHKTIP
jgi:hypothetical protein